MDLIEEVLFSTSPRKRRATRPARIERLSTEFDRRDGSRVQSIGNAWSRLPYGGEFGLMRPGRTQIMASLVFVQTRDGNTGGPNPGAFGGRATDQHLIYEGPSRVAADAVLAGAGSVHRDALFSVWHPDLGPSLSTLVPTPMCADQAHIVIP
jgi:hypothetical protein